MLASGAWDDSVRLWRVSDGVQMQRLIGHSGRVFDVAFAPDGAALASAGADGQVLVWEPRTGRVSQRHTVGAWSVEQCNLAEWWRELASCRVRWFSYLAYTVDFSPDGRWLIYGDDRHVLFQPRAAPLPLAW
jgi:WD40 repeat protein